MPVSSDVTIRASKRFYKLVVVIVLVILTSTRKNLKLGTERSLCAKRCNIEEDGESGIRAGQSKRGSILTPLQNLDSNRMNRWVQEFNELQLLTQLQNTRERQTTGRYDCSLGTQRNMPSTSDSIPAISYRKKLHMHTLTPLPDHHCSAK